MRSPGPVSHGSPYHIALHTFSAALAERFGMAPAPALGLLLKFDEQIGKAVDTGWGMSALKISVVDPDSEAALLDRVKKLEAVVEAAGRRSRDPPTPGLGYLPRPQGKRR